VKSKFARSVVSPHILPKVRRFLLLGRFLIGRSSGVHALRRGLPLYLAIGIAATILFARQGLDARTVVRSATTSLAVRLALLLAWLAAALPVVRAIVMAPDAAFLRALPVPRWQIFVWLSALLVVAEAPWLVLWSRGGGPLLGAAATTSALALHAQLLRAGPRTLDGSALLHRGWGVVVILVWMRLGTSDVPHHSSVALLTVFGVALAAFLASLDRAWQRASEHAPVRPRGRIAGAPARALASAYARVLERRHGSALVLVLVLVVAVMGFAALALRNDPILAEHALRVVLACWIPVSVLAAAVPAKPILRSEHGAEWVLAASGTALGQRRLAHVALMAIAGASGGLAIAAALGVATDADFTARLGLAVAVPLSGALLAGTTALALRWAFRDSGHDGARAIGALLAVIAVAEGALFAV
jgi:hypothetical protein